MSRPGQTRKPCPACGSASERPVDSVCSACVKLIEEGRQAVDRKRRAALGEDGKRGYRVHPANYSHGWPYIPHASRNGEKDSFRSAFSQLVHALAEPLPLEASARGSYKKEKGEWVPHERDAKPLVPADGSYGSTPHELVLLPEAAAQALADLYAAVRQIAEDAYTEGKKDGSALLVALAQGEVSVDKFNRACGVNPSEGNE